jgi:hypothetical protein
MYDSEIDGRNSDSREELGRIAQSLRDLPRVKAAPDFEQRLHEKIGRAGAQETQGVLIPKLRKQRWQVPAFVLTVLAFVCVGVISYYMFLNRGVGPAAPILERSPIGAGGDTTKSISPKHGDAKPSGAAQEEAQPPPATSISIESPRAKKVEMEQKVTLPNRMEESKENLESGIEKDRLLVAPQLQKSEGKNAVEPESFKAETIDTKTQQRALGVNSALIEVHRDTTKQKQDSVKASQRSGQSKNPKEK